MSIISKGPSPDKAPERIILGRLELLLMLLNFCPYPVGKNMNMFCVNAAVPLLASPELRKSERGGPFKNLSASISKSFFSYIQN